MRKIYQGSCHCGAVRFECALDLAAGTTRCNCSFCRKARFWMAFSKASEFHLLQGQEVLTDYQRAPPGKPDPFLNFNFCSRCGVRAFTRGGVLPGASEAFYAVNLACLDNATDQELAQAPIHFADGRHDKWQSIAMDTKYL